MKLSWTPPDSNGGSPIIRYVLEYREKASENWTQNFNVSSDASTVVKCLEESTEYEFRVYAENEVGLSDVSTATEAYRTLGTFFFACLCVVWGMCVGGVSGWGCGGGCVFVGVFGWGFVTCLRSLFDFF